MLMHVAVPAVVPVARSHVVGKKLPKAPNEVRLTFPVGVVGPVAVSVTVAVHEVA